MWRLISAGDHATSPLVNALRIDDQQTQREVAEGTSLLELLTKLKPPERETVAELVAEKLAAMGPRSIADLRERFAARPTSDLAKTFDRARGIQARNKVGRSKPTDETWRLRRAKRALSIIDTPQARRALWTLSEPGKFETHDEQFTETQLKCD